METGSAAGFKPGWAEGINLDTGTGAGASSGAGADVRADRKMAGGINF
jgi:hypothetical protein